MDCAYFEAELCRSCALLETPYTRQLADKQDRVAALLPALDWEEPVGSAEAGFRNKAKMVVAGTVDQPTLGILDPGGAGVDLQGCMLHTPGIVAALPVLAEFVTRAALTPYDVPTRRGELKHLIVTESPDSELMVRFVLRSQESIARIRKHLGELRSRLPGLAVVSANLLPQHAALLEGADEITLYGESLRMRVNDLDLHLRPQSFFQTNTEVAASLYRLAREWVLDVAPSSIWDLYCGVGGFGLHLAGAGREVLGIETSAEAVASARLSAEEAGLGASFETGDATAVAAERGGLPDLVVVNPPRRGIGPELGAWLEASDVPTVLYSSCNAESLAKDLAAMPSLRPVRGRLLDMFPHTSHYEVAVLLTRG